MDIAQVYEDGILEIAIDGELDASSSIQVDDVVRQAFQDGKFRIAIDCGELRYISSAGLGVFISHQEDIRKNRGLFVFYNMSEAVLSVFNILGLDKIFIIVKDKTEARQKLNES